MLAEGALPRPRGVIRPPTVHIRIHVGQRRPPPPQGDHRAIAYSYPRSCWLRVPFPGPGGSSGHRLFVSAFMLAEGALPRPRGVIRPPTVRIRVHVGQRRPPPPQGDHRAIAYPYPRSCWLKAPFPGQATTLHICIHIGQRCTSLPQGHQATDSLYPHSCWLAKSSVTICPPTHNLGTRNGHNHSLHTDVSPPFWWVTTLSAGRWRRQLTYLVHSCAPFVESPPPQATAMGLNKLWEVSEFLSFILDWLN